MSLIAHNAKRIIAERGIKQGFIAKKAGYTENTFSNMLNGRKRVTDLDVAKIAAALGVTPNDLFVREPPDQAS